MQHSLALLCFVSFSCLADDDHIQLTEYLRSELQHISTDPVIINAINAQNAQHAHLSQHDIQQLDKKWRTEIGQSDMPMIQSILDSSASQKLIEIQNRSNGKITEIFVMDNRGLNVAQSAITTDYWQGDELKWQNTYLKGVGVLDVSDIEKDESTQVFQAQISYTIAEPSSEQAIGAVTIGVNVDAL